MNILEQTGTSLNLLNYHFKSHDSYLNDRNIIVINLWSLMPTLQTVTYSFKSASPEKKGTFCLKQVFEHILAL